MAEPGFVKGLRKARKPKADNVEGLLAYHLHRHLAAVEPARDIQVVHASDVTKDDYCSRQVALHDLLKVHRPGEFAGTATQMVWKQGRILAQVVAKMATDLGMVVADWQCAACGDLATFQPKPEKCTKCSSPVFFYREVRVTSMTTGISCGLDLLVQLPGAPKLRIFELKTMDKEVFKKLAMPLAEARVRTQLYLRCLAESGQHRGKIDTQRATIFYISKGGWGKQFAVAREWGMRDQSYTPFAEYEVKRDDKATQVYADRGVATTNWLLNRTPKFMPDGPCGTAFCDQAQACAVSTQCFSGKYPAAA